MRLIAKKADEKSISTSAYLTNEYKVDLSIRYSLSGFEDIMGEILKCDMEQCTYIFHQLDTKDEGSVRLNEFVNGINYYRKIGIPDKILLKENIEEKDELSQQQKLKQTKRILAIGVKNLNKESINTSNQNTMNKPIVQEIETEENSVMQEENSVMQEENSPRNLDQQNAEKNQIAKKEVSKAENNESRIPDEKYP